MVISYYSKTKHLNCFSQIIKSSTSFSFDSVYLLIFSMFQTSSLFCISLFYLCGDDALTVVVFSPSTLEIQFLFRLLVKLSIFWMGLLWQCLNIIFCRGSCKLQLDEWKHHFECPKHTKPHFLLITVSQMPRTSVHLFVHIFIFVCATLLLLAFEYTTFSRCCYNT